MLEPKRVLIDQAINPFVTTATDTLAALGSSPVPHLEEQIHDSLLEEVRMAIPEPVQKLVPDSGLDASNCIFDHLDRIGYVFCITQHSFRRGRFCFFGPKGSEYGPSARVVKAV